MPSVLQSKPALITIGALLLLVHSALFRWPAERQVRAKQESLLVAVQDASWGRCEKLISSSYQDRWGWNHDDIVLVMKDVRSQFMVLTLTMNEPVQSVAGGVGTVNTGIRVSGRPLGLGSGIQSRLNRVKKPATFTWTKESFWPWSWRLTKIDHSDVDVPETYQPGDLVNLSKGDFNF